MSKRLHIDIPVDEAMASQLGADELGCLVLPATDDEAEHVRATILALMWLAPRAAAQAVSRNQIAAEAEAVRELLPVLICVFNRAIPVSPGAKGGTA